MGEHIIFEGNENLCAQLLPYARRKMAELRALPGVAKSKVIAVWPNNRIVLTHNRLESIIRIKASLHDGYEFVTHVDNPTDLTLGDTTYLFQLINFQRNESGGLGKIIGRDKSGGPLDPNETPGDTKAWLLTLDDTGTDHVPRDTHYIAFNATTGRVTSAMSITCAGGRRHAGHAFGADYLLLNTWAAQGNPVYRAGKDVYPKSISSARTVAGGMYRNGVFVLPSSEGYDAIFEFRNKTLTDTVTLQMPMPSWANTSQHLPIPWIASPDNDRMVAVHHHFTEDGSYYWKVYQGWVELSFDASLDANGDIDGTPGISWERYRTPGEHERYAAVGYDLSDQTNLKAVRFRAYLSNSYLTKTGSTSPLDPDPEQNCRALAIYAEWFEIDAANTPQAPYRTVLMWHGPLMGQRDVGEGAATDEGGTDYDRWDVTYISEAFEEAYGYPYYEAKLMALDLRADAYALQRFMPDPGQGITGRWQTEYSCLGSTPVVTNSGASFSEPSLSLATYTELTDTHGAWEPYLVQMQNPNFVSPNGYKPFDWYIAALWHPFTSELGPTAQHREYSYGGFAIHPNKSWSIFLQNEPNFIQSVYATDISQIFPPASMTIDEINVKEWDDDTSQTVDVFSTTHLDVFNSVRELTHTYGDETTYQMVMGSATWGIDPEAYTNGQ